MGVGEVGTASIDVKVAAFVLGIGLRVGLGNLTQDVELRTTSGIAVKT